MNGLERYFRWHGKLVATYPLLFLLATTITTVMFGLGLISFREEADLTALWVPVGRRGPYWSKVMLPRHFFYFAGFHAGKESISIGALML